MMSAEGSVLTGRADRYLDQLCRHLGQMRQKRHRMMDRHAGMPEVRGVEHAGSRGEVRFADGAWTLTATPEALLLRVDAVDEQALRRLRDGITGRVEKIGRRDRLTVTWQSGEAGMP
ncbi:MAG TPA: DUF2218 domain-containing protein [Trebonia sp.]